jgi:tetratricopeptide (TPR) repeat protein
MKYIDAPQPEIYDLRADPRELRNLYPSRQAAGNEMRDRLNGLIRRLTPAGGAAGERELTDPALLERLKSLGYVAVSAGTFAEAGGKSLPDPKDRIGVYDLISSALSDSQRGRHQESLLKLQRAEKTETRSVTINYLTALNYFRLRDFPRSIERLEETLRIDPKFALAAYYLGQAYVQVNDLDRATAAFERALELDPTNFVAAYNLGAAYLKKQHVEAALRQFERAAEINPDYAPAHLALGEVFLYLKRPADAARALERAAQLAPRVAKVHTHLAQAYQALGRADDAAREFEKAKLVTSDK